MMAICPCCADEQTALVRPYRAKTEIFSGRTLVACSRCGFVRVNPVPTDAELGEYYGKYWKDRPVRTYVKRFTAQAQSRVAFLQRHVTVHPQQVLDVGAGYGFIQPALAAQYKDFVYDTVETDVDAVKYLLKKQKARHNYKDLQEVKGQYDLIILAHILEHMADPLAYLITVRERLSSGGMALIELPNQDYLYKDHEEPHLSFFAKETLSGILNKAGFEVLALDTCGREFKPVADIPVTARQPRGLSRFIPRAVKDVVKRRMKWGVRDKDYGIYDAYGGQRIWLRALVRKGA